ncbi:C-type lectin domain family 4 member A-like [Poecilia formosa]|uniref:C-type lectin domain family 4 member A-like n=1 Tax=Poecilia formosa TaxID=48698 RepID=A0A087Y1F3_POEFO|nr:PREDICTED: C-type lectin domain family 4 member A-like [Poecilia formosa]
MEEELNYANVTFKTIGVFTHIDSEKLSLKEIIYDEVKTEEKTQDTHPIITENEKRAQFHPLPFLGMICFILLLAIIILSVYFTSEQRRQSGILTKQNRKLAAVSAALRRRTAELHRERNRLNWTLDVILEYNNFPAAERCPQKQCTPCPNGWAMFQSNCYLFTKDEYSNKWKTWQQSQEFCVKENAKLAVIDSQEEQEFINNKTKIYHDKKHGYWIGLKKDTEDMWTWSGGRNLSVTFWSTEEAGNRLSCGLINPHLNNSSNWAKTSCDMKNRWICETRVLIRPD